MKQLGLKSVRFPGKRDYHPRKGHINWWEVEMKSKNGKVREKRESGFEISLTFRP